MSTCEVPHEYDHSLTPTHTRDHQALQLFKGARPRLLEEEDREVDSVSAVASLQTSRERPAADARLLLRPMLVPSIFNTTLTIIAAFLTASIVVRAISHTTPESCLRSKGPSQHGSFSGWQP